MRWLRIAAAVGLWLAASHALAGITIHFEGRAADAAAVERILETASAAAAENGWPFRRVVDGEVGELDPGTVKMIEEAEGSGAPAPVRGIVIYPHAMSEPLYIVFGPKSRTKNFVKTQFAGAATHVKVVELLERVAPLFTDLDVDDEGQYWGSHDRARLDRHLEAASSALDTIHAQSPQARGPVKRPDGRIQDIVR